MCVPQMPAMASRLLGPAAAIKTHLARVPTAAAGGRYAVARRGAASVPLRTGCCRRQPAAAAGGKQFQQHGDTSAQVCPMVTYLAIVATFAGIVITNLQHDLEAKKVARN